MAKTIHDMAVRDTAVIVGEAHDYYVMGANAVLQQIENIIDKNEDGCIVLEKIQLRISELKDE